MKILLMGGTGAMGNHLSDILAKKNCQVTITSRKPHKSNNNNVRYLLGNAKDHKFISEIMVTRWDCIIDFMIYTVDEFEERLELFLNSTSQYVFLSSSRVYENNNEKLTEESIRLLDSSHDDEFLSLDEYSLVKARQENLLLKSTRKNWTIVRPYITYDSYRLQLGTLEKEKWLFRAMQGKTIVFSKDMLNHFTTMTYGKDVALGIYNLLGKQKSLGEIFHITQPEANKWSEVLEIYLNLFEEKLGFKPKVICLELDDFLSCYSGRYQVIYDRLFDRKFNNDKINAFVDTSNFVSLENGLTKSFDEFLSNPKFLKISWYFEAKLDRITKERTSFNLIEGYKQKLIYFLVRFFYVDKALEFFKSF